MGSSATPDVKFIYQLPFHERKVLCTILDQRDSWEELGGVHMKLDMITIHVLRREILCGRSPTDALLWHWSQQNHTVLELFVLLSRMQHYQAMSVLKPFVDERYHRLIYEGEENLGFLVTPFCMDNQHEPPNGRHAAGHRPRTSMDWPASTGMSEAQGAMAQNSTDKNLRIDSRNMNVSEARADMASKVVLPAMVERKILNTQGQGQVQGEVQRPRGQQQQQQQQHRRQGDDEDGRGAGGEGRPPTGRKGSAGSDASSIVENCSSIPLVEYAELEQATGGWNVEAVLGRGGFGTVYKGIWNNTAVAIKRLEQRQPASDVREQDQLLLRELSFPNSCRHDNVLPIYGVSLGGAAPCLVYQFMPNGSVEDRLRCRGRTPPLSWVQRLKIAEGTALGLQFLHKRPVPVIHGDIKSANILLGAEFEPRIADFGLAREGPRSDYTHVMVSRVHGTRPYLPEEFLRSRQFSVKVDTYSYGVVLFELATGLRAYQEDRANKYLKDHMESWPEAELTQLSDRRPAGDDCGVYLGLVLLGKQCVARLPRRRPDMVDVLQAVRELVASTEPLRAQQEWMQQSRAASSLAALREYVAQHKRGSSPSPQPSLPAFPHPHPLPHHTLGQQPGVLLEEGTGQPPVLAPVLPVHEEELEEETQAGAQLVGPQDGGALPRFSVLLSLKQEEEASNSVHPGMPSEDVYLQQQQRQH